MFAESAEEIQLPLNSFEKYCSEWRLSIHVSKTKIVVLFEITLRLALYQFHKGNYRY
jgi:hypothetical protein